MIPSGNVLAFMSPYVACGFPMSCSVLCLVILRLIRSRVLGDFGVAWRAIGFFPLC
jgi:hypothetical protein